MVKGGDPTNPEDLTGVSIGVEAGSETPQLKEASGLINHVSIAGGGALEPSSTESSITVSEHIPAPALLQARLWFANLNGTVDQQAGSHPFTETIVQNFAVYPFEPGRPAEAVGAALQDEEVLFPPGLVGALARLPQCPTNRVRGRRLPGLEFGRQHRLCTTRPARQELDVYNVTPQAGTPAELAFNIEGATVHFTFSTRSGGNGATISHLINLPPVPSRRLVLTLLGTPPGSEGRPIFTMPSSCGAPQSFVFRETKFWEAPSEPLREIAVPLTSHG